MNIVLSSQSPNRKSLLKQLGLHFQSFSPHIEETQYLNQKDAPQDVCLEIAKAKALKAQPLYPDSIIIASDQMAYLEGQFYGKAISEEKAFKTLSELQGKTHQLLTSLYMIYKEDLFTHVCISQMTMRPLNSHQIKNYIALDKPLQCAGSYHIEERGISLFEKIETDDFNGIIGLPLITLTNQLIKWGYPYLDSSS